MNVGELKKSLENIEDDDLNVHFACYAELDEYKDKNVSNGRTPLCIRC